MRSLITNHFQKLQWTKEQTEVVVQPRAEGPRAEEPRAETKPRVERLVDPARARTVAGARALTLARALTGVRALALALALSPARSRALELALAREKAEAKAALEKLVVYTFRYDEVLADSDLKDIIYSIEPSDRRHLACDLWQYDHTAQQYWWFIQIIAPITRLPLELLQQIFLVIIDEAIDSPLALMGVSKHWYNTVTGIWASLKLGTTTQKDVVIRKLERNQRFLDVLVDTEIDRGHFTSSKDAYQAIFAAMEAISRWRSLVVETFPAQADLPADLVNRGLQHCSDAVMSRLRTFKIKCTCEMSPLLDRLLRILGTSASRELTTVEINSADVISFLLPTYSSIFGSVTMLSLNTPGLPIPVDLLPHLYRLEAFNASHLSFPIYDSDVNLPFVHTLRHVSLKAVSIQWMSGRTFHVLKSCTILLPLHHRPLHTFSTTLPICKDLTFQGYPLDILHGVSAHKLARLSVVSSSSYKPRGNRQLVRFSSRALQETRLVPRSLHISIEATTQAWIKALAFMSNLEELVIHSAQPSSLGVEVLQSLVVHPIDANNPGTTTAPGGWNTPVCPSLKRFGLRYYRWLRTSEHFDLIPEFMSIILSRKQSEFSLESFRIWTGSDRKHPLELIEGLSISPKGFERLKELGATGQSESAKTHQENATHRAHGPTRPQLVSPMALRSRSQRRYST